MNVLKRAASRVRAFLTTYWVSLELKDLDAMKARRAAINKLRLDDLAREHAAHRRQLVLIERKWDDESLDLDHQITKTEIHLDRMAEDIKPSAKVYDFRSPQKGVA